MAERQADQSRFKGKRGAVLLWAPWLIGAVAWAAHQNVSYWLSSWLCAQDARWLIHLITAAALALAGSGALLAWRSCRGAGTTPPRAEPDRAAGRIRFMALGGLVVCAVSVVGIVLEWLPNLVLDPCAGIP